MTCGLTPLLIAVLALTACASKPVRPPPPPLAVGQTIAEASVLHEVEFGAPIMQFATGTSAIKVFPADVNGRAVAWSLIDDSGTRQELIFEDDRYVGTLKVTSALAHPECLLHPEGRANLALRLRALAAGAPDPAMEQVPAGAAEPVHVNVACPMPQAWRMPAPEPTLRADDKLGAKDSLVTVGGYLLQAPFVFVGYSFAMAGDSLAARSRVEREQALALDMTETSIVAMLGKPSRKIIPQDSSMRILLYGRKSTHDLLIGLQDGRAVWILDVYSVAWIEKWEALGKTP